MEENSPFIFRINENVTGPNLLMQVCLERGWRAYDEPENVDGKWNLWWRTKGLPTSEYIKLMKHQFTNHIPRASFICRKDNLTRYLKCMQNIYGSTYGFIPEAYHLPLEYKKLISTCKKRYENKSYSDDQVWICKPVGQSQGRGISIFRKPSSELVYNSSAVVQKYVQNPLLVGGYKFDLRLYVFVPSYHPLTIYIYREGLTRFGTDKFSLNNLHNRFAHLTNSSINRLGPGYTETKERVGAGCKWTLQQLRCYLKQKIGSDWLLWQQISGIIILTIATQLSKVPNTINCFELYGFDVLIDSSLKPWLMEVNLSPALGTDCSIDPDIKKPMLHDMFDLLGLPICDTGLSLYRMWSNDFQNVRNKRQRPVVKTTAKWKLFSSKMKNDYNRKTITMMEERKIRKNITGSEIWGNGKTWKIPKNKEGNWIRVYPNGFENKTCDKYNKGNCANVFTTYEIKTVVNQVSSYLKIAKQIFLENQYESDEILNSILSQHLSKDCITWLPPA